MKKAKHCDECANSTIKNYKYKGPPTFTVLTCNLGHLPRFFTPRGTLDNDYGWKRNCSEFVAKQQIKNLKTPCILDCDVYNQAINTTEGENAMTLEQSLAARKIADMLDRDYPKQSAINAAAAFIKSQGFSAEHARKTAEEMADLLY